MRDLGQVLVEQVRRKFPQVEIRVLPVLPSLDELLRRNQTRLSDDRGSKHYIRDAFNEVMDADSWWRKSKLPRWKAPAEALAA